MLQEVSSLVELARDHAILGFYPESLSMFEQAMSLVNSALKSPNDLDPGRNWNKIKNDLNEEYSTVRQLNLTLTRLRPLSGISQPQQQVVPLSRQELNNGFPIEISNNHYRGPAELGRFKGLPFSHHKARDPIENIEEIKVSDSFSELPSISESSIRRIPNPPSKPKTIPKPRIGNTNPIPKPARPFKPPAKLNPPTIPKSPSFSHDLSLELSLKPRKSFIESIYPDGQGPDSHLIQLIEQEINDSSPGVSLDEIAELDDAKSILNEAILLPSLMPEFFTGIRRPWKGILLFGPPGTGKTMLAKAIASMGGTTFFNITSSFLISKWRGESEKLARLLFEMARFYAPSILFFDEIDSIMSRRNSDDHEASRRLKTEILIQIEGISTSSDPLKRVIVMAATNRPWDIDEAMIRRLEKRIYISLPSEDGRRKLFERNLSEIELGPDIDWEYLVKKSKQYTGADISCVCRDAAMEPLRKLINKATAQGQPIQSLIDIKLPPITMEDLKEALTRVKSSVDKSSLEEFKNWMKSFGSN
ncbi:unnamed protein product [Blepharisma stoltei]|uniref:Katanin p60 ATPase-containing subunit A1 n=1 Tax=Blepharisma stoltei TaxID=1481888 RepID=A0AAU9JAS2_9CILI|nr:unnamed protein product [Blepharisma stoltei]